MYPLPGNLSFQSQASNLRTNVNCFYRYVLCALANCQGRNQAGACFLCERAFATESGVISMQLQVGECVSTAATR